MDPKNKTGKGEQPTSAKGGKFFKPPQTDVSAGRFVFQEIT